MLECSSLGGPQCYNSPAWPQCCNSPAWPQCYNSPAWLQCCNSPGWLQCCNSPAWPQCYNSPAWPQCYNSPVWPQCCNSPGWLQCCNSPGWLQCCNSPAWPQCYNSPVWPQCCNSPVWPQCCSVVAPGDQSSNEIIRILSLPACFLVLCFNWSWTSCSFPGCCLLLKLAWEYHILQSQFWPESLRKLHSTCVCVLSTALGCPDWSLETPEDGEQACSGTVTGSIGSGFACNVRCPFGSHDFVVEPPIFYLCEIGGSWEPHNWVPDCSGKCWIRTGRCGNCWDIINNINTSKYRTSFTNIFIVISYALIYFWWTTLWCVRHLTTDIWLPLLDEREIFTSIKALCFSQIGCTPVTMWTWYLC